MSYLKGVRAADALTCAQYVSTTLFLNNIIFLKLLSCPSINIIILKKNIVKKIIVISRKLYDLVFYLNLSIFNQLGIVIIIILFYF